VNSNPRFISLRIKLAIGFALAFTLASGLTTYIYYQNGRAQLMSDIRARLRDAVAIGALQVDAEAHSQLTDPSQEGGPTYMRLKKTLQNIRDAGTNVRFVYTMQQDAQGNIIFVVDAEETEEDVSHLGDVYDDASPWLKANFSTIQSPAVEDQMYTDKWGTWLTGYAPFYLPNGKREGLLGMDISAQIIIDQDNALLRRSLLIFLVSMLGGLGLGLIFGTALTVPLSKLRAGADRLSSGDFTHRVNTRTNDEVGILGNVLNATAGKIQDLVTSLEQRVEERTLALSRKTSQLQAATQVARQAAAIKDTATLLNDAVRLISDQFGFYHAGIFLLDENGDNAILQAASSVGGQQMLARGHRLQVGKQGIVGFVAAQKRSRIALDTGADAVYFNNPDLPETRSEAALPLIVRDRVIGVLDIQSKQPQAFSSEDIETFQTLADQLALAIENARLLQDMNNAVQQLQQVASERAGEAWKEIAQAQGYAYRYTPLGIQPATKEYSPTDETGRLQIPILLHNHKIGEIKVKRKEEAGTLDSREQAMLKEIATQVALALENARLLEEAQQRAAYERSLGEIAARIDSAHDVDAILRITAQEIGKAIGDSEIMVQINPTERKTA